MVNIAPCRKDRLRKDTERALKNLSVAARAYTRAYDDYMAVVREEARKDQPDHANKP